MPPNPEFYAYDETEGPQKVLYPIWIFFLI